MRTTRPPIVLRVPREAVYAAIVVAFLFLVVEATLRIQHARTAARRGARPYSIRTITNEGVAYAHEDGQIALVLDPHLVYRTAPGQRHARVTINQDGFRGGEWRHPKAPATRRVVVLGGSAAFGVGTSGDSQVFTAPMEAELDARARGRGERAEVWNAGVVGYDSTQELVLLATRIAEWSPDAVVIFDGWNDFNASAVLPERYADLLHPKFCEIDLILGRRSRPLFELMRGLDLYRSFERGALRWLHKLRPDRDRGDYTDRSATAAPRYERNLRTMIRLCRGFGARPVVVAQPELFQRRDPPPGEVRMRATKEEDGYGAYSRAAYPRFVAAARAAAAAESALFVDGMSAFQGVAEEVFTDCVHLGDRGNELLARRLAPEVAREMGWEP